jgi:hypothetical protein
MNAAVDRLLAGCEPPIAELARGVCALVLQLLPSAVITVHNGDIGFGTAPGYKGLKFVVSPHSGHVTLGITRGAGLPDPAGLMEGKGRVHRHIKIRTDGELERPALRELMAAAARRPG